MMNGLHVNAVGSLVAMLLLTGMTAPITLPDTPVADAAPVSYTHLTLPTNREV